MELPTPAPLPKKKPRLSARHRVARRHRHRVPLVGDVDHLHVAGGVDRLPERAEPAGVRMKEHPDAGRAELCEDGPGRRAVVHLERFAARQRVGHDALRRSRRRGRAGGLLRKRGDRRAPRRARCLLPPSRQESPCGRPGPPRMLDETCGTSASATGTFDAGFFVVLIWRPVVW